MSHLVKLFVLICVIIVYLQTSNAEVSCITNCTFTFNLTQSFQLPSSCTRVNSNGCFTEILIDYTNQINTVRFLTSGLEQQEYGADYLVSQTIDMTFYNGKITREFNYYCFTSDGCDEQYAKRTIPLLSQIDHQPVLNELLPNLYTLSSELNVTECFDTSNNLLNCTDKLCNAGVSLNPDENEYKGCDVVNDPTLVNIEITSSRAYPTDASYDTNDIEYICNINRCNGASQTSTVRVIVYKYNSLLEIIAPTYESTTFTTQVTSPQTTRTSTAVQQTNILQSTQSTRPSTAVQQTNILQSTQSTRTSTAVQQTNILQSTSTNTAGSYSTFWSMSFLMVLIIDLFTFQAIPG
ncbi:unnamed protein product [Didymodactylos carnosus]|uniref:Uncharacterized protein n=1 Tax=Didymodactylos carnosus TaxID=1234261 RepID=A0A8S2EQD0_9BILA|nr:unnamed protein product [Didymodactylos carnosus]CAF4019841.1 unnamed protein product [Didymodactylos carnosus]